jgi:hypothetical protein
MKNRFTLAVALLIVASLPLFGQNTSGTWSTNVEADTDSLTATTVAPLGKDKSLNCSRNVIPVKFKLDESAGSEDLVLVSDMTAGGDPADDFSLLTLDTAEGLTVSQLTNLTAVYEVVDGNCGGGSLRWSIDTTAGNVWVYYGVAPTFTDCDGAESQSGVNLLSLDDARVDSSQVYPGTQVNTWDAFVAANPDLAVESVSLVADGGWSQPDGIQSFSIASATVNDNTFTGDSAECDLPDATIRLTGANGEEVTARSVQTDDDDAAFREDDCQYIYNLVNPGPGTYTVEILVDGAAIGTASFIVSCSTNNGNPNPGANNGQGKKKK